MTEHKSKLLGILDKYEAEITRMEINTFKGRTKGKRGPKRIKPYKKSNPDSMISDDLAKAIAEAFTLGY